MTALVWIGAALTLAGIAGIVWIIVDVRRARRAKLEDDAMRGRLMRAVMLNLAALGVSGIGLALVIVGLVA